MVTSNRAMRPRSHVNKVKNFYSAPTAHTTASLSPRAVVNALPLPAPSRLCSSSSHITPCLLCPRADISHSNPPTWSDAPL